MRRTRPLLLPATCVLLINALLIGADSQAGATVASQPATRGKLIVRYHAPDRPPTKLVLFLSGENGWNPALSAMVDKLCEREAFVAEIDTPSFKRRIEQTDEACLSPATTLEQLAREIRAEKGIPAGTPTMLAGYGSGGALVYAALAAAAPGTFAGGVSLDFCPEVRLRKPPCAGRSLLLHRRAKGAGYTFAPSPDLAVPWIAVQGAEDRVCPASAVQRFAEATLTGRAVAIRQAGHHFPPDEQVERELIRAVRLLRRNAEELPLASIPEVADLPLIEVPATGSSTADAMAVFITGDGGWADLDKAIGDEFAKHGIPVVGWSSIRYYWTPRTPELAARDLARVIDHYRVKLRKQRVMLIGYSFGSDVIPFLTNRLPPATRANISALILVGLSHQATFEFHAAAWLGIERGPHKATVPELQRLGNLPTVCVVGDSETDSACPELRGPAAFMVRLPGGHHFDGSYAHVARIVWNAVDQHVLKQR
jgi:type IV secretory pathway VirJ component